MTSDFGDKGISEEKLNQELLSVFLNDMSLAEEWLDSPLPVLSGKRPRNMFSTPENRQRLFDILQAMKFGETT